MIKIKIGNSDYSKEEIERGNILSIGCSRMEILQVIEEYERKGYKITFQTSLLRKIFGIGIYKIIASKPE